MNCLMVFLVGWISGTLFNAILLFVIHLINERDAGKMEEPKQ